MIIELYPKLSPNSVKRFKMLIETGEYNDVAFHRVIKKFLVQAGDLEYGKKNNINYVAPKFKELDLSNEEQLFNYVKDNADWKILLQNYCNDFTNSVTEIQIDMGCGYRLQFYIFKRYSQSFC